MKKFEYDETYLKKLRSLDARKDKLYYMLNGKKDAYCYLINDRKSVIGLNIENNLPIVRYADDIICRQHEEAIEKYNNLDKSYTRERHFDFRLSYEKLTRYCFYFLCDFDEPLIDILQTMDIENVESLINQVEDYQWMYSHFIFRDTKPWFIK